MLSLLKKLWNWLKSLFIASPKAINPKEVKNTPPEPSDGEYEGILMGLFEQVAAGTTTGGLRGWLYSRHCNDKKLARWLEVKSEEWLQYPEDYQTLGRDLAALGKVMTGNLGEVSQRISLQLRDAVRDVSGVEEENLGPKETDLTEVVQDAEFWFVQGYQKYMNGDFIGAIASFDRALEIKPDKHEAWNYRGIALDDLGRLEEAIASWDRALEMKPDYPNAWSSRGIALLNLGRFEEAIASFDRALEIKPDYPNAWVSRGVALVNLGRFEQAIASWDRALEIKPDFHLAWYNRGVALDDLGRLEEAIASYDRALEIKPDDYYAWNKRGIALDNLGRFEEAIASYDRALEIKPDYYYAWNNRGIALDNLGRFEEAIASYDKALEFKPDYHEAWYGRGWSVCSLSKNRVSTPSLEALIYRKPIVALNDREPHIFALREALPHLIQGSPPWGQIYRYLGEAYLKHSRYKENASPYWREAIRHYQIALPILSEKDFPEDHLEILQGLIRAHLSLQEIPEARFYQQQGRHLFTRLRAQKRDKPAFEAKFSSFSHLEIDLLIEENHPLDAIEQAEFYKNRCLTWILDSWQENPTSPDYATIQSLTGPNKAIIYWYLSEDNLTTFIITAEADPVILEPEQRRQPARQFRTWLTEWDKQYLDYASKKETENKQNHPWRLSLNSRFAQLKRILQIDKILEPLPVSVDSLILIPHRDLHRFPLHTLFPEKYTATYLPSAQVGLRTQSGDSSYSPLLSVEDPKTEQKPMDFAQLESAIISHILQPSQRISPEKASRENVPKALENAHKTFHFTGHGFYDSFRPQESAIALSDGLLTVRDINKLNLSSYRLVCLAACETALTGKDGITTEYVGLVSAFLAAGATNVVSTLWPVKEISSAWFMVNFYQRLLAGESPALALKNTQNWLKNITWQQLAHWIEQLGQLPDLTEGVDRLEARAANILKEGSTIGLDQLTEYSDPYYWAAYTLTGQD
ncbi:MAG: tetratricopeptide repeat protein [Microcystis aeruginosa K13-05]|nr:tetratricopeptide repeat protein [Microcystis aeruginosa K13-05]